MSTQLATRIAAAVTAVYVRELVTARAAAPPRAAPGSASGR